jgi:hypothetical protein
MDGPVCRWVAALTSTKEHLMGDSKADDVKDALKRDLEQTKADLPGVDGEDLDQDAGDTVRQALGKDDK